MDKSRFKPMKFIHLAMVMAVVIYGVVFVMIDKYAPLNPVSEDVPTMKMAQIALIVYFVFLIFIVAWLKKHLLSKPATKVPKESWQNSESGAPYYGRYMTALFILWATIESLAVFGIIYYLVFVDLNYALLIITLCVMLMLYYRPREDELMILAKQYDEDDSTSDGYEVL